MTRIRFILLLTSLILVYTQGLWERLFNFNSFFIFLEISIWLYLLLSVKYFLRKSPGIRFFFIYIILSLIIGIINGSSVYSWLKYIRYLVYFYLIYISLWHSAITSSQWQLVYKFIIFLILVQGIGSAYNIFILDQRVEGHVGLMSSLGGTTATIFPLLITALCIYLYFVHSLTLKFKLILLSCLVSVVLVGYASAKRAVFFTIPLFIFITIIVTYFNSGNKILFLKRFILFSILIVVISPLYFNGIKATHGFNYYLAGNESNRQVFENAVSYTWEYEDNVSGSGLTTGRSGSTFQIIAGSTKNWNLFFFGNGFGSVKDEDAISKSGVQYGIVGFTRDIFSAGWILMIIVVSIIIRIIFSNKSLQSGITGSIRIILISIFLFTHFVYSSDFSVHLKINFILAIICAFINSPLHSDELRSVLEANFDHPREELRCNRDEN